MDRLVLKENLVFMVSREDGDVQANNQDGFGMYYKDTRYLSVLELSINGYNPALLTSSGEFNFMGNIQSSNPLMQIQIDPADKDKLSEELKQNQTVELRKVPGESAINTNPSDNLLTILPRTISIRRNRFIQDGMHERLGFRNYNSFPVTIRVKLRFGSDFRDMFDVRGYNRTRRGSIMPTEWHDDHCYLRFSYMGLDNQLRTTDIKFDSSPTNVTILPLPVVSENPVMEQRTFLPYANEPILTNRIQPTIAEANFVLRLEPEKPYAITYHVIPQGLGKDIDISPDSFDSGAKRMRDAYEVWFNESSKISTDHEVFDTFLRRSLYDLRILTEELPTGLMPVAGIPWFAVPFGRDSIITALQSLIFDPQLAVGTLRFLAQHQGKTINNWNEEAPGKILHEIRFGEMTVLKEMPQVPYYGAVDSTPLFIMLFAETMNWLGSDALYQELLPNIKAALNWIDEYGDMDGDGFIEYECHNPRGVLNQGWKDNRNSLQFRDGTFPEQPIALCEAQGYVYAAKMWLANVVESRGETVWASQLREEAAKLKKLFNEKFWLEDEKYYAQALDKTKRAVPTITSNPGHCLWTGIIDDDKAALVMQQLTAPTMLSGWGVRTISEHEPTYNPMSYHNGTIWPHDNSLIAAGFKRYHFDAQANTIISQIFAASQRFRYFRLPELFCGFQQDTRYYSSPSEYPVSCSPQAWTAGAALLFVQTLLGLQPDAARKVVRLRPAFPNWLNEMTIENMAVAGKRLAFKVTKQNQSYILTLLSDPGDIQIEMRTF